MLPCDLGKAELIKAEAPLITTSETFGAMAVGVGRDISARKCGSVRQE